MNGLFEIIEGLKQSKIKNIIDKRIREFRQKGKESGSEIFKELCFCIMTANFNAERGINIQEQIGDDFLRLGKAGLAERLKQLGHRFPNTRAGYIIEARKYKNKLKPEREWLVKNIKGLGYKEASHFLRNIGFDDFAIIDFHIIDILTRHGVINRPKTLSKSRYLEIEDTLKSMAKTLGLTLAELDLYLWYLETKKVLK